MTKPSEFCNDSCRRHEDPLKTDCQTCHNGRSNLTPPESVSVFKNGKWINGNIVRREQPDKNGTTWIYLKNEDGTQSQLTDTSHMIRRR